MNVIRHGDRAYIVRSETHVKDIGDKLPMTALQFRLRGIASILQATAGRKRAMVFYRLLSGRVVPAILHDRRKR